MVKISECIVCGKSVSVDSKRSRKWKTCSQECSDKYNFSRSKECPTCLKLFKIKPSHSYRRKYCSKQCQGLAYTERYLGERNPNFKNKNNVGGYELTYKVGREFIHRLIVKEYLNLSCLPKGYQVHHRDCNRCNNKINNLVLLNNSDHRWLHKQYGNATLWAYYNNKISKSELVSWSDDMIKAQRLLDLTIENQRGVFKSDELLEKPEMVNQQASSECNNLVLLGSEKLQRLGVEETIIHPRESDSCSMKIEQDDDIVRTA